MEDPNDGFIQRAEGYFDIILAPNTPHCGPQTSPHPLPARFNYAIEVTYDPDALDANGFLLDNTDFQQYFDGLKERGMVSHSCELLCKDAAEAFCQMLGIRAAHCFLICARIWGLPGVSIEYRIRPAKEVARYAGVEA